MVSFHLDELTDTAARRAAVELKIDLPVGTPKADVVAAIKAKLSPDAPLVLTTMSLAPEKKGWRSPSVFVAVLSLCVAISSMGATWWGLINSMNKLIHELDLETKRTWQTVRVYDIVNRTTLPEDKWGGVTFDEVRSKYLEETTVESAIIFGKGDLQADELRRILQELNSRNLIHVTHEGKFVAHRQYPLSKSCFSKPNSEIIQKAIIHVLTSESGKVSVSKMVLKVSTEHKLAVDDVYATANCMKTTGAIQVDQQGMVWSALEAPNIVVPRELPHRDDPPRIAPPVKQ